MLVKDRIPELLRPLERPALRFGHAHAIAMGHATLVATPAPFAKVISRGTAGPCRLEHLSRHFRQGARAPRSI